MWWKLAVERVIKRKKKSTKRKTSAKKNKKKRSKESGKRSTLESLPSLDFESIILLHFTAVSVSIGFLLFMCFPFPFCFESIHHLLLLSFVKGTFTSR